MKGERRASASGARRSPGRKLALVLAVLVHVAFIGVLVWSVRWQSRPPEPIVAELYAPPPKVRAPDPEPRVEPPPPRAEPKVEPPPPPPPKVEPDQAEIALKAKREEERKARERQAEEQRKADERRAAEEKRIAEQKRLAEEKRKADEKRAAEARERQKRETDAMLAQAEKEAKQRAEQEAKARADAESRAKAQAEANARSAAQADWIRRIQAKVRGNVIVPPGMPGNPEAVFEVIQLPTGEILDVRLVKTSGVRAYDEAVNRAILKSSPLPRPDRQEMFQRILTLKFRPLD